MTMRFLIHMIAAVLVIVGAIMGLLSLFELTFHAGVLGEPKEDLVLAGWCIGIGIGTAFVNVLLFFKQMDDTFKKQYNIHSAGFHTFRR